MPKSSTLWREHSHNPAEVCSASDAIGETVRPCRGAGWRLGSDLLWRGHRTPHVQRCEPLQVFCHLL